MIFGFGLGMLVFGSACSDSAEKETADETAVQSVHPVMYLTADKRALVLENSQTEPMESIYLNLIERSEAELRAIDSSDWSASDHGKNGEIAVFSAFLAWLHDDEAAADRALAAMAVLDDNWADHVGWGINIRMPATLLHYTAAWDFLMATPYLSAEDSAEFESKITSITDQFFEAYVLNDATRNFALTVTQNNHPIRTASAIGFVGLAFPDHPDSSLWLDWAVSELDYLLGPDGHYIQPDGVVSEGSFYFSYGLAPTLAFFIALENTQSVDRVYHRNCINRSDVDPWAGHGCVDGEAFAFSNPMDSDLFRDVMDWSLALRFSDGDRAPIADAPFNGQAGAALFTAFGGADYLYWDWRDNPADPYKVRGGHDLRISHLAYVTPKPDASPPLWTTRFFTEGGMAAFRSGWDSDARILTLMGESGSARKTVHDHVDGTSIVMAAYGDMLLMDTGYYKPNDLDNAVTSGPESHNVIFIDGEGAPDKGLLNDWGGADAYIENPIDGNAIDYAESRQRYAETDIVRSVAMVRDRYFVIADRLNGDETTDKEYRLRWHAHAGMDLEGTVETNPYGPLIAREKGSLSIFTSSTQGVVVLEEPPFVEYEAPHVHKIDKEAGHHRVFDSVFTGQSPGFLTVLAPFKTGVVDGLDGPLVITPIETDQGAAWTIAGDGFVDVAWVREANATQELTLPSGEVAATDAAFVLFSLDSSMALLSRGTTLSLNGSVLATSEGDTVTLME